MMMDLYRQTTLDAAPRRRYPSLMWAGILRLINQADQAIAEGRVPERHAALMRAQRLVGFLDAAFRDDVWPEVAPAVHGLHRTVVALLVKANLGNDRAALAEARALATTFHEMWSAAADRATPDLESRWRTC